MRVIPFLVVLTLMPAAAADAAVPAHSRPPASVPRAARPAASLIGSRDAAGGAPESAIRALAEGRHFHASLILRDWLASTKDTTAADLLLAARAEAGWSNWERVEELLAGRSWLDTVSDGRGWDLLARSQYEASEWEASRASWARFLEVATSAPDRDRGLAELYRAHSFRESDDNISAIAAYDRAAALLPDVVDWIGLQAVSAAAALGDTAAVRARLGAIDAEIARDWGWRQRVRAFREAGDSAGALAAARGAATSLPAASRRADAYVEAGRLLVSLGRTADARDAFRAAVRVSPGTSGGIDGARFLSDLSGLTPDDRLMIGRAYLRAGNYERGTAGLQAWVDARKGTPIDRDRIRLEIGRAYFRSGRYDAAERILTGVAGRVNETSTAATALLYVGRAQYRDGRITQGRRTFLDVARRFPAEDATASALYLAADLEHDDGDIDEAVTLFRRTTASPTDVEEVGLAHMRLGGIAYNRGDWAGACDAFETYRGKYPNGRRYTQATYWTALAHRKLGEDSVADARLAEVVRLEPLSYYGWRAAATLGRQPLDMPLAAAPATDSATAAVIERAMAGIDRLRDMDWTEAAMYEISRLRSRYRGARGAKYALAEALNERGFTMTGIEIGWELFRGHGWDDRLLRIIYPFPYRNILVAEAREAGVDPFIAAGLIRQESMFFDGAVSPAGAIGLMQVTPGTGRALARQLGVHRFSNDMLKHAEYNAHLGMKYLAQQFADYDGRLPVVFAAYNAGPQRITRWREFPEFADDDQFAERIPFAETRDYVKIVQGNARIYRALYSDETGNASDGG
ncbi:MAG: tetratricopeptide repeat protein [Gemmatimonadota bacterium]|jgi:soluble lytic murein transglycosylase